MAKQTDQQKGLRHLSRSELIEIIYRQQLMLEDLQQRLADSKEKCGELTEQIRNFESNRSLSARTEQLDADIQSMGRQLDALNEMIRRGYSPGSQTPQQSAVPGRTAASAPVPPPPPPASAGRMPAAPMVPPVPRRTNRPAAVQPKESSGDEASAPTIADKLRGQPFRAGE